MVIIAIGFTTAHLRWSDAGTVMDEQQQQRDGKVGARSWTPVWGRRNYRTNTNS